MVKCKKAIQQPDEKEVLVNVVEELVRCQVKEAIIELGACNCETCYLDACALALNNLESKYATTKKGALFFKLDEMQIDHQTRILVEVTKAVARVMECPRHAKNKSIGHG